MFQKEGMMLLAKNLAFTNLNNINEDEIFMSFDEKERRHFLNREKRRNSISDAVRYACQYWISHIMEMHKSDIDIVREPLHQFMLEEKHLLHWLEVSSVIGTAYEAHNLLLSLYHWLKVSDFTNCK